MALKTYAEMQQAQYTGALTQHKNKTLSKAYIDYMKELREGVLPSGPLMTTELPPIELPYIAPLDQMLSHYIGGPKTGFTLTELQSQWDMIILRPLSHGDGMFINNKGEMCFRPQLLLNLELENRIASHMLAYCMITGVKPIVVAINILGFSIQSDNAYKIIIRNSSDVFSCTVTDDFNKSYRTQSASDYEYAVNKITPVLFGCSELEKLNPPITKTKEMANSQWITNDTLNELLTMVTNSSSNPSIKYQDPKIYMVKMKNI